MHVPQVYAQKKKLRQTTACSQTFTIQFHGHEYVCSCAFDTHKLIITIQTETLLLRHTLVFRYRIAATSDSKPMQRAWRVVVLRLDVYSVHARVFVAVAVASTRGGQEVQDTFFPLPAEHRDNYYMHVGWETFVMYCYSYIDVRFCVCVHTYTYR